MSMEITAKTVAELVKGKVEGNPDVKVSKPARIESGKPGTLCFLANPKYEKYLYTSKASIILLNSDFKLEKPVDATIVRVEDAYKGIATMLDFFNKQKSKKKGKKRGARVAFSAKLGKSCYVGPGAYIGRKAKIGNNVMVYPQVYVGDHVEIGDNTILYPGAKIYHECKIGRDCIIHAGAVIGSDGFGFATDENGKFKKIPQLGNVIIEDDVEIGANTTIDRAVMDSTIIRKGVKLDNLIQIAHNVEVGENTGMAAQVGISGSTKIGKNCLIAGQVGIAGHLEIADDVKIGAKTGLSNGIKEKGSTYLGIPGVPADEAKKQYVVMRRLPQLYRKIQELEKQLNELKDQA